MSRYTYMADPRLAHHVQGDLKKQFYKAYGRDEDGVCAIERYIPNERIPCTPYNYELPMTWLRDLKPRTGVQHRIRLLHNEWLNDCNYPIFDKRLYNTSLCYGQKGRFEVNVRGKPKPEVRWYKDKLPVFCSDNVEIRRTSDDTHVLIIKNATAADEGLYECQAYNMAGNATSTAYVQVDGYSSDYKPFKYGESAYARLRQKAREAAIAKRM